jgi:hypothetical protein
MMTLIGFRVSMERVRPTPAKPASAAKGEALAVG